MHDVFSSVVNKPGSASFSTLLIEKKSSYISSDSKARKAGFMGLWLHALRATNVGSWWGEARTSLRSNSLKTDGSRSIIEQEGKKRTQACLPFMDAIFKIRCDEILRFFDKGRSATS